MNSNDKVLRVTNARPKKKGDILTLLDKRSKSKNFVAEVKRT